MKPSNHFITRLIKYYKSHSPNECLPIWTNTHSDLHTALMEENSELIQKILENVYIKDLWGLDYDQENSWKLQPYEKVFDICLNIISKELKIDYKSKEYIINQMENNIGVKLDIPIYPNRPIIQIGDRNVPLRFLGCYYIFYNIITKHIKISPKNILEIGAGTGYFPYLFTRNKNVNYYIIDLPIISVIQTYIYATMIDENKIWFHGEGNPNLANIFIYSPDVIDSINISLDFVINHNSFVEIPQSSQSKYLQLIKKLLKKTGFFYSLNWEPVGFDQSTVKNACDINGFHRHIRSQFLLESYLHENMATQYFEEIYIPIS